MSSALIRDELGALLAQGRSEPAAPCARRRELLGAIRASTNSLAATDALRADTAREREAATSTLRELLVALRAAQRWCIENTKPPKSLR
jgi:hypothetical protein